MAPRFATRLVWLVTMFLVPCGCAFPRRSTPITPAPDRISRLGAPEDVYLLHVLGATVPDRKAGGMSWDEDGSQPDVFVRVVRGGDVLWESAVRHDAVQPEWDAMLPRNVRFPHGVELRFELWDDDGLSSDPIGVRRYEGLPTRALPGAPLRVTFASGAALTLRLHEPRAHRGLGVRTFEIRSDALKVVDVEPLSPAGRAGLGAGDRIMAIDGRTVAELGGEKAASMLGFAAERGQRLTVKREDGRMDQVALDRGYIWMAM